ncbi:hypothetical protein cyc_00502 [Cyclospora cayetanensis]|uniref:rRNA biogenesis protein RRP36 n=1 Tax=Cyclospora cayetanensis TaxID=88456 RepID=A0A1D3CZU7_9EIME|nr:hypothetical protein cyc_00502 [Cyclospora cayetanensis]
MATQGLWERAPPPGWPPFLMCAFLPLAVCCFGGEGGQRFLPPCKGSVCLATMRGAAQRLTLQELRRLQQKATTEAVGSTNVNVDSEGAERGVGTEEPQQKGNGPSGKTLDTFKKGRAATKVKNRSNNKAPREFGCRRRVRTHGALVLPDGEAAAGPLLLAAAPVASAATRSPTATTPEVEAYRKAVAAHQLRKLRGGLEQRSAGAKSRDPRFSSLCGDLNVSSCSKAYAFVEEQQQQLMRQLQRVVRTGRVPEGHTEPFREGEDRCYWQDASLCEQTQVAGAAEGAADAVEVF